jgi:hypothetical protein
MLRGRSCSGRWRIMRPARASAQLITHGFCSAPAAGAGGRPRKMTAARAPWRTSRRRCRGARASLCLRCCSGCTGRGAARCGTRADQANSNAAVPCLPLRVLAPTWIARALAALACTCMFLLTRLRPPIPLLFRPLWLQYAIPSLVVHNTGPQQGAWSPEEDAHLRREVGAKGKRWKEIGAAIGRSGEQCRDRWRKIGLGDARVTGEGAPGARTRSRGGMVRGSRGAWPGPLAHTPARGDGRTRCKSSEYAPLRRVRSSARVWPSCRAAQLLYASMALAAGGS